METPTSRLTASGSARTWYRLDIKEICNQMKEPNHSDDNKQREKSKWTVNRRYENRIEGGGIHLGYRSMSCFELVQEEIAIGWLADCRAATNRPIPSCARPDDSSPSKENILQGGQHLSRSAFNELLESRPDN
jgi:hypothetical protein